MLSRFASPLAPARTAIVKFRGLVVAALVLTVIPSLPASPHTHVDRDGTKVSWYPRDCCNDGDCQPAVSVRLDGEELWFMTADGRTVGARADKPRRTSLDMRWHICMTTDGDETLDIHCIFEPPST